MNDKIIFVYNANSGILAALSDTVTKIVAPAQYECNLCKITYGPLAMKEEWSKFLETLPQDKKFLYKTELINEYQELNKYELPSIFLQSDNQFTLLISKERLNAMKSLAELKNELSLSLAKYIHS